ncbi:MAG TPA: protein translocase subunit SecF [bacterium]|nr:protein translocase subunit SecF [bacterium]
MQFLTNAKFDFMSQRRIAMVLSMTVILVGLGSLVIKGGPKYSIDFTGGTLLQLRFPEEVSADQLRTELARVGLGQAEIVRFGAPDEMLVRIQQMTTVAADSVAKDALRERWPDLELRREETVGPKIGGELRGAAGQAILLALALILIYITIRFEFRFAVAAIVALVHDVVITLGVFSLANHEISLAVIAAFLTIVGYSLNDTIVVFDRVRENLRIPTGGRVYAEILNQSINQSLSRTIITSGTTILVVVALLVLGGEVLRDFSFALTVGVLVGTYSSIYVATPILAEWEQRSPRKRK